MSVARILVVPKKQSPVLPISLPCFEHQTVGCTGAAQTLLRKGVTMKINLSINHDSYVRLLMKLAALTLLATPVLAQNYAITDLGTFGPNSNGNYSIAYCVNNSGQVGGSSSAPST